MNWEELKEKIYYWDGSWRDIYIKNTTKADWKKWTDFVNQNYRIEWFNERTGQVETKIDFDVILEYWDGNENLCSTANVFIDKIQINAHFFISEEIENDIDPREIITIEDHYKIVNYMTELSVLLGKTVILTPENEPMISTPENSAVLLEVQGDKLIIK